MVLKEVISIHIGQCGLQFGTSIWELFLIEHNINIEGMLNNPSSDYESCVTFFQETLENKYVPRALLIDSEYSVIDEIRTGIFRKLFNPKYVINGFDDGANNFARGSFCLGKKLIVGVLHNIRRLVEDCELLQGFILNHSVTGGTGSGLTSVLIHALSTDYFKKFKFQVSIIPGNNLSTALVDPYNETLHLHSTMDASDLSLIIENQCLYDINKRLLLVYSPYYIHINRIIAILVSSVTCSMRFGGPFQSELIDIGTNLIPFPRIHFPLIAHAPIIHESRKNYHIRSLNYLFKEVFSQSNLTVSCNLSRGSYMAVLLNARGDIPSTALGSMIEDVKEKKTMKFVEWSPKGFKVSFNGHLPVIVPESEMSATNNSLTMMCNNTVVKEIWTELGRKFDLLFIRRAYLHWYLNEGMEETEFMEARLDLAMLWEDYEELSMNSEQIERELVVNPSKYFRYSSSSKSSSLNND